jgi:hypothetical protein
MVKALFDTNILIDHLNGIAQARTELASYEERCISIVSWMEVMAGSPKQAADRTRSFLSGFELIGLDAAVADRAVDIRRLRKIKLPDAVVWASAQVQRALLVTRNIKDFPKEPGTRHPYAI